MEAATPPAAPDPGEEVDRAGREQARHLRTGLVSVALLGVLVAALLLAVPGLASVSDTLGELLPGWIAAAVALEIGSCLGYVLTFLHVFERAPIRFGARVALTELAFGGAVSLGGAGGLAVGAWLLHERGAPPDRIAQRSVVLFTLTSAANAFTLVAAGVLCWAGVLPGPGSPLLTLLPAVLGGGTLAFALALPRVMEASVARRKDGRLASGLVALADGLRDTRAFLRHPDWRLIGPVAYLWCDIGALWAMFRAAGTAPPIAAIVLAYQIGYLANIVPIPGNIGVLDGSLVGMLVLCGIKATPAAAATVAYHAVALWIPALWGTLAFVLLRRTRGDPLVLRPARPGPPG